MKHQKRTGFSLGELCAVLLILSVVAAILFPFFAKTHERSNQNSCHSNIKQIELAMLQYIQDYDEKFPPCAQPIAGENVLSGWALSHDYAGKAAIPKSGGENGNPINYGLLSAYVKNYRIFRCSEMPRDSGPLTYMYNDLAAGVEQKKFAAIATTVLVCDGEDFAGNVGHSYEAATLPAFVLFARDGTLYWGATLQTAPRRHSDGANYGYADGHVKWSKPEAIFFPSRLSASRSHKNATGQLLGPDPANLRTPSAFDRTGFSYNGTFHVK